MKRITSLFLLLLFSAIVEAQTILVKGKVSDSQKNALKGGELFYLSEKLKILLVCAFLIEIGFDKELITRNLDNVKWRLFNHLANWRDDK